MTDKWFCYEIGPRGWHPVVYHGEKPAPIKTTPGDNSTRTALQPVSSAFCDHTGEPVFKRLTDAYPPPQPQLQDGEPITKIAPIAK